MGCLVVGQQQNNKKKRKVCVCVFQAERADKPLSTQLWMINPRMKYTQCISKYFILVTRSDYHLQYDALHCCHIGFFLFFFAPSVCVCRVKAAIFLLGKRKLFSSYLTRCLSYSKIFMIIYRGCAFNLRCHLLRHL